MPMYVFKFQTQKFRQNLNASTLIFNHDRALVKQHDLIPSARNKFIFRQEIFQGRSLGDRCELSQVNEIESALPWEKNRSKKSMQSYARQLVTIRQASSTSDDSRVGIAPTTTEKDFVSGAGFDGLLDRSLNLFGTVRKCAASAV